MVQVLKYEARNPKYETNTNDQNTKFKTKGRSSVLVIRLLEF